MKKLIVLCLVLLVLSSIVYAKSDRIQGASNNNGGNQGQGNAYGLNKTVEEGGEDKSQGNAYGLNKTWKLSNETWSSNKTSQGNAFGLNKTNLVRVAVHTLLAVENRTGGIGRNISLIARGFNNSVQNIEGFEARIRGRSLFQRMLFGGDVEAAGEIEQEVEENEERLEELIALWEDCDCDDETMAVIQEQIQLLVEEQLRLKQVAWKEKQGRGMFGWLWK